METKGKRGGRREGSGRKRGTPNKSTIIQREVDRERRELAGLRSGKVILSELANHFRNLMAKYQENSPTPNPRKYDRYSKLALKAAAAVAPYEDAKLSALAITQINYDLSKLSDEQLDELDKLTSAATVTDADRAGEDQTRH